MENYKVLHNVNILLGGNHGVGKTSIVLRYVEDKFNTTSRPVIGIEFRTKKYVYNRNTNGLISLKDFKDPLSSANEKE
jgi:GTPase SAR1 family protein